MCLLQLSLTNDIYFRSIYYYNSITQDFANIYQDSGQEEEESKVENWVDDAATESQDQNFSLENYITGW